MERLLTCVNVGVLFQVLCKRKALKAKDADMLFLLHVGHRMTTQRETCRVLLVAALTLALERLFHVRFV